MINSMKSVAAMMLTVAMMFVAGCKPEDDPNNGGGNNGNNDTDVRVTTYTPQDITATTAKCGGDVIVVQGLSLNELGVCWSTEPNPTIENAHVFTSNWREPYVCTIVGLMPDTKYHVRAYALRGLEYYYGEVREFTTNENNGGFDVHTAVDLGLPSGTLWAVCNVGATIPEDYGEYFAWGETEPRTTYNWANYKYCNGSFNQLTKYCNNSNYGYNAFTDNLTQLLPEDDAATDYWGEGWCIPTATQWEELYNNTTNTWTTWNGVKGFLFSASNGNGFFLPTAGQRFEDELYNTDSIGLYWSSSLNVDRPWQALPFKIVSGSCIVGSGSRFGGLTIRPVRSSR